jgi:hypothetical protein
MAISPIPRDLQPLNAFLTFLNNYNTTHAILEYSTEHLDGIEIFHDSIIRKTETTLHFERIQQFFQILANLENQRNLSTLLRLEFVASHFSGTIHFQKKSVDIIFYSNENILHIIQELLQIPFSRFELNLKIVYPRMYASSVA